MRGPARAQLERHARHRLLVRRLDDVDEVEVPERRPLRLHGRPELLDLVVDLADARGVVPDGLHALRRERREHDPGRHCPSLKWLSGPFYPILPPLRGVVGTQMDTSRMTTRLRGRRARRPGPGARDGAGRRADAAEAVLHLGDAAHPGRPGPDQPRGARPRRQRIRRRRARRHQLRRQARPHGPGRRRRQPPAAGPAVALPGARPGHVHAHGGGARQPGQHGLAALAHDGPDAHAHAQARQAVERASASRAAASPRRRRCGRTTSTRARCARRCGSCAGSTTRAGSSRSSASRSRSSARSSAAGALQVDQQRKYSRAPDGVNVRADIDVQRVFTAR